MSEKVCRLCLRREDLIDIFECTSESIARLKTCISLATGIAICQEDDVSKNVCMTCIRVTMMLYKFRKNALANDKTLKEHVNKQWKLPGNIKDDSFNQNLLDLLQTSVEASSFTQSSKCHSSPIQLTNTNLYLEAPKKVLILQKTKPGDSSMLDHITSHSCTFKSPNVKPPNSRESTKRKPYLPEEKRNTSLSYKSDNDTQAGSLLTRLDEEPVFACSYCNEMFKTVTNLKTHQRAHRFCCLCNGIFQSQKALSRHQQEICFKHFAAKSPRVLLSCVDRIPEKLKQFPQLRQALKDPIPIAKTKENRPRNNLIDDLIACANQIDEDESDSVQDLFTLKGKKKEPADIDEPSTIRRKKGKLNKTYEYQEAKIKYEESIVKEENTSMANLFSSEIELKPEDLITHMLDLLQKYTHANQKQNLHAKKLRIQ